MTILKIICVIITLLLVNDVYANGITMTITTREYKIGEAPVIENKIDSMDVYTLAKDARKLYLGHMLSWELKEEFSKGKKLSDYSTIIRRVALKFGLDEYLIAAVIQTESSFNAKALSEAGAQGLMQLMPATAKELKVNDPYDPEENIEAGSRYLAKLIKRFNGDIELALAAYNAGAENVVKFEGVPPFTETQNFVKRVKSWQQKFSLENKY